MKNLFALTLVVALFAPALSVFLSVRGEHFYYGNDRIFLSGTNFAWNSYGYDFGNHMWEWNSKETFTQWLQDIRTQGGGNTVRVWIHIEGENTPEYNSTGFVTAPDTDGTFIDDMSEFLDIAYQNEIFIIPVLWNGAVMRPQHYINMINDDAKLQSFIDNSLIPTVRALKNKPALGAWEIMNEPEGAVIIASDANPCFNTDNLRGTGAGWTGEYVTMKQFLKFINWQTAAIKTEDPKALVTLGSWNEIPQTDQFGYTNYYKDSCLIAGGGKANGIIDFYQIHTYAWEGAWQTNAPFRLSKSAYNVDKPMVIGEFAEVCSQGEGIVGLYDHAYTRGYNGALVWQMAGGGCADTPEVQYEGMRALRNRNNQTGGGLVNVDIRV